MIDDIVIRSYTLSDDPGEFAVGIALDLARSATGDTVEQQVVRTLADEVNRQRLVELESKR